MFLLISESILQQFFWNRLLFVTIFCFLYNQKFNIFLPTLKNEYEYVFIAIHLKITIFSSSAFLPFSTAFHCIHFIFFLSTLNIKSHKRSLVSVSPILLCSDPFKYVITVFITSHLNLWNHSQVDLLSFHYHFPANPPVLIQSTGYQIMCFCMLHSVTFLKFQPITLPSIKASLLQS